MIRNEPKPQIIGQRNGINIRQTLKAKTKLKANKHINQMSSGKYAQTKAEQKLKQELVIESNGLCTNCKQPPDWRGLSKHEKIFRSHGGDPLDKNNVELLCGKCHNARHGIFEK